MNNPSGSPDLLHLARIACEAAVAAGAEFCDVSVGSGWGMEVEVEDNGIKSCNRHDAATATIRCFRRGGSGLVVVHGLEPDALVACAKEAAELAQIAEPDPDFKSLPLPADFQSVGGLFDEHVRDTSPAQLVELARENIAGALETAAGVRVSGAFGILVSRGALVNNLGVEVQQETTSASCDVSCVVRGHGEVASFSEFDTAHVAGRKEAATVGRRAAERALRYLGARTIPGGRMPVVLGPLASSSLIGSLARAANAESIQRNRSFFAGKLGRKVAATILSILDDGFVPFGVASSPHDGEGQIRNRVQIIEEGVLTGLLHDSYTAGKAGTVSTGHGRQTGGISPSNLRPKLGPKPASEIIASVENGIYVESGGIAPSITTGEISAMVDYGIRIENGELTCALSDVTLGGHILEVIEHIEEISSDYREVPGTIMPTMLLTSLTVASGE